MTIIKDLSLFKAETGEPTPYEKHFLVKNPFPGRGETEFDVCTDQDDIKDRFVRELQSFSEDAKRLRINGKNGAGKTNILRYFERLTDEARERKLIGNFYPIYVYAPGESYFAIHRQIIDKLAGHFLDHLIAELQKSDSIDTLSSQFKSASEPLKALKAIAKPAQISFLSPEERQKDAFLRWLKGQQKLTVADKRLLTDDGDRVPPIDITSSSIAMRFLNGLLLVLKEVGLCDGVVLLFDEFEEIFEALTRSRQALYAQDLRHLFDILKESVFFVTATTPEPKDLKQYPAIEHRLGEPVNLQPISSEELAIEYVSDYLNSERDRYEVHSKAPGKQSEVTRPDELKPLTQEIVAEEYRSLKAEAQKAEIDVLPGAFLPRMRERMRQIVENGN